MCSSFLYFLIYFSFLSSVHARSWGGALVTVVSLAGWREPISQTGVSCILRSAAFWARARWFSLKRFPSPRPDVLSCKLRAYNTDSFGIHVHVNVHDREKIGQLAAELFTCEALESMLSTQAINRAASWKHVGNVMQVIPHNTADSFALHTRRSFDKARDIYDETVNFSVQIIATAFIWLSNWLSSSLPCMT